jgi:transketolase
MRNTFIEELVAAARRGKDVALVVGDLGYKVVEPFADAFPHRFFNAGVAEQNMMGLAAGMASEGMHVFVYSIANFPTFRCAEQVRNDVDYHNLPVTIVSVGGGLAYGNLGYSHHAVQDYALLRSMPNMLIFAPGDSMEVRGSIRYLTENPSPSYLRLGKGAGEPFHCNVPTVRPGEWLPIRLTGTSGPKKIMLSTGTALKIARGLLSNERFETHSLYSLPSWGMRQKSLQPRYCVELDCDEIVTVEDHLIDGGFGSWFLEALLNSTYDMNRVKVLGLDADICGMVGSQIVLSKKGIETTLKRFRI